MTKGLQVTLSDIARKVDVSKVTVSKALRGHPDISDKTAKRIRKVARELGYFPNYMARNLSSQRSNSIGVIVPKISNVFFSSVIEAIYDAAFEKNYQIILNVSQENAERELRHVQSLLSMRVDGLIVYVSENTKDYSVFQSIRQMGIAMTFMGRPVEVNGFNTVSADDRGGAFAATEQAISIGYRKIGHLAGFQYTNVGRERYGGFESALKQYGVPVNRQWVVHGEFSEEEGYKSFMNIYQTKKLPEFILVSTFPVAVGVYRAAAELGLRIPDDIDIIGFGDGELNRFLSPPMSYVEQPTLELGQKAFQLTLENIQQQGHDIVQHIKLPTKLVLCKTCITNVATGRKEKH